MSLFRECARVGHGCVPRVCQHGCYHRRARGCGRFHVMPNIKQQKKRVRIAAEERLENIRYASAVKTFTRRLRAAVAEGDRGRISAEHRELVRQIDKRSEERRGGKEGR